MTNGPTDRGAAILAAAEAYTGVPYGLPPGPGQLDCSLLVIAAYRDAGYPFPAGIRTAEQERQACKPVDWGEVQPGDLLFFEHTYNAGGTPGPDGKIASHIGISYGAGSGQMIDAHLSESRNGVGKTNVHTPYWQDHLLSAGRFAPVAVPPLTPGTGGFVVSGTGGIGLRVRAAAGTSAPVLGTLPEGTRVAGDEYAWRHVKGHGLDGWVADEFLVPTAAEPAPQPPQGDPWEHWSAETIAAVCKVPQANVEENWPLICVALVEHGIGDQLVQAGAIGTIAIETASTFQPVREAFWLDEEWRKQNLTRYYPYYGRGVLQLTWLENYRNYGEQTGAALVNNPDLALDPDISAQVLAIYFDQRGVADAARERDWGEVRRRVQGGHVGLDRLLVIVGGLGVR